MSTHPLIIDNLAFAKKNERIEGVLSVADCPRLFELLQSNFADEAIKVGRDAVVINYILQGSVDAVDQHYLRLMISAKLLTICQRCLSEMPISLKLSYNYLIGESEANDVEVVDIDSDDVDLQEASQVMDVFKLIEDEVIMAMPIAPIHDEDCGAGVMQSGEKPNPFAVLKSLIKS
ncbi:hypothetical protein GALL_19470 [mine drainage metagenome]|uniref:Large ribosomal RNA subunit accumulation protein YceD n=1 Tax=mine drainage metagenome TaxID=410659 RepID=A0A1J5TN18_9ZZZZ